METVSVVICKEYEHELLRHAVIKLLEPIGGISAYIRDGDRVLLKPNLLAAKDPDKAVTTHPALVRVVAELVREAGGIVKIGDSPGIGGFLKVTEKTGMHKVAIESGADLIEFKESIELQGSGTFRSIRLARAYYEADKIINLPKLKTHEMMTMTCAVKNLFGAVIGTEKAGWHLKAGSSRQLFARLLLEIYQLKKPVLTIVDAVLAMEGNGPGNGTPISLGLLIAGTNPVAVDVIAGKVAGIPADLLYIEHEAVNMGLNGAMMDDIMLCGVPIESVTTTNFKLPTGLDAQFGLPAFLTRSLKSYLTSYPKADMKTCVLCGICSAACPPAAITIQNSALSVDNARCIRCWCCRELCPHNAMQTRKSLLLRMLTLLSGAKTV